MSKAAAKPALTRPVYSVVGMALAPKVGRMAKSQIVDELGYLKAQIATLTSREKTLKDELAKCGVGAYEGQFYRATVSEQTNSSSDDVLKTKISEVVAKYISAQFRKAHTRTSTSYPVRVVAKRRDQKETED